MNKENEIPLRRFKTLLVVDLEATCWGDALHPREDMETIEFGGVLVRMSDLQPIDERSWFIKPKLHPVLSDYCTNLTSITQDQVDAGLPFEEVTALITAWLEPHQERLGWGSWGNYDRHQLQKDARRLGMQSPLEPHPHTNLNRNDLDLLGYTLDGFEAPDTPPRPPFNAFNLGLLGDEYLQLAEGVLRETPRFVRGVITR